jgi:hypothetical protein
MHQAFGFPDATDTLLLTHASLHCPCFAAPATQGPAATHMECDDGDEEGEQQPRQRHLKRLSPGVREIEEASEEQELGELQQRTRQRREQVRCTQECMACSLCLTATRGFRF